MQGSGVSRNGTKLQWVRGNRPNWVFQTVTEFRGADGVTPIANGSVARDRDIIGGRASITVTLESGSFVANDTGKRIVGYRLDIFGGADANACKNFKNRIEVGSCSPGSDKCPELKSPIP